MPMTVHVGIIGAGKIGRIHAKAYGQRSEVRITAVADIDERVGQALATEYGADYYRDYEALLLTDLDAVSIGLPDRLHHQVAMAAAASGKHILLEKPMCATLSEADEIIAACRSQGVKLMLAFRHRFHAEIQLAKRLIEEGQLGQPVLALDALSGGGPPGSGAWTPWYWDEKVAIGGILTSAGIHGIDRLRWLMGSDIEEVHSYMGTFGHKGELEDNLVASLRFEGGAIGSIVQNFNFFTIPGKYDLEIYGTQGALRIRTGQILEFASNNSHFAYSVERDDPFGKEIAEFVSAILAGREPAITGEDGKASLAVALAIYRSVDFGAPVRVENMYKEKTT
jgi:UDP-N-acetylglucosamine 3-dehydrogenase